MEFKDKQFWTKTKDAVDDFYDRDIVSYAERWAEFMEVELTHGRSVAESAYPESLSANMENVSHRQFRAATNLLIRCWKHGDKLKAWDDSQRVRRESAC